MNLQLVSSVSVSICKSTKLDQLFYFTKKSFNGRTEEFSNCLVLLESQLKSCFQKVADAWSRLLPSPSSFAPLVLKPLLQGAGRCLLGYPGD